jgi:2-dehydro-3-deoxy-L-rhamnonate dehydrogenase (NAD+)
MERYRPASWRSIWCSSMKVDLNDRVAVVTGGARGIGRAIVQAFADNGARVVIVDIDGDTGRGAAEDVTGAGGQCLALPGDVSDPDQMERVVSQIRDRLDRIDILVNNAGITGGNAPTWQLPAAEWRRVVDVNLIGPFLTCSALVPGMVERGYGRVVNIASVAGKEGNPNASHYSASKAGLIALTKSLGKELAGKGVLVNCVTPAAAKTDIFKQMTQAQIDYMLSKIPMGRFVAVEEIAALACWLATEECSFSTGAVFDVTGGRSTY